MGVFDYYKKKRVIRKVNDWQQVHNKVDEINRFLETDTRLNRRPNNRIRSWSDFDRWTSDVGDNIRYNIDNAAKWIEGASIWLMFAFMLFIVIVAFIQDGLFLGILVFFIGVALSTVLFGVIGILSKIFRYLSYIPLYCARLVFYRGWTFLLLIIVCLVTIVYFVLKCFIL